MGGLQKLGYAVLLFFVLVAVNAQGSDAAMNAVGWLVVAVLVWFAGSAIWCFTAHKELVEGCGNCRRRYEAQIVAERKETEREARRADMQRLNRKR